MIRFEKVTFNYSDAQGIVRTLFRNLDFEIKAGEYLCLSGPNGVGKSTLARLAKGVIKPDSGRIYHNGQNAANTGVNHRIGYIFSNPENQIVSSIVAEDVAFGPENQGKNTKEINCAVNKGLRFAKIEHLRECLTHQLSGGEQQMILIAGILAMDVDCIIFDEALSMLDPIGRKSVLDLLRTLNEEENIAVLHITHYIEDFAGADRVVILENGTIRLDLPPDQLLLDASSMERYGLGSSSFIKLANKLKSHGFIESVRSCYDASRLSEIIFRRGD